VTLPAWFALLAAFAVAAWAVRAARVRTSRHEAGRRFFRHPTAGWGIGVLAFFAIVAVAAPLVTSYDPREQLDIVHLQNQPPSWSYILGTDVYSRDLWSRVAFGARISLLVGSLGMLVAVTLGTLVGAVAGYYRRWVDAVLMRSVDVGLALPRIFVLLIAISLFGQLPLSALVLVIGFTSWFGTSRLVRAEVLSVRERDYVAAARAAGAGPGRVIFRHVLPNAAAPIIVSAALGIGNVLLLEASLSFLGIGVPPPAPSWGNMIADGAPYLATAPWTTLFPGLAIALVVMALNAVGDALRDALDPRQEGGAT
jgi:peptide/nickel transport system permease protein